MASQAASVPLAHSGGSAPREFRPSVLRVGSVYVVSFFISGKPVAKQRPRTTKTGHTYTPENTRTWESHVGWELREQMTHISFQQGVQLPKFEGRVVVDMRFNFVRPKSTPKKVVHKLKKPDYDNLAKSITDSLQNVGFYKDDALITDCMMRKRFADDEHPEGVELELTCWT